jgi:hypothetical protein
MGSVSVWILTITAQRGVAAQASVKTPIRQLLTFEQLFSNFFLELILFPVDNENQ